MNKKYDFVKYTGNSFIRGDGKIAIHRTGVIRLSARFCHKENIKFTYVSLFYDSYQKTMAIRFIDQKEDGSFKVTKDKRGGAIWAKTFFSENNIVLEKIARRYEWNKWFIRNIGEVFIIDLKKELLK